MSNRSSRGAHRGARANGAVATLALGVLAGAGCNKGDVVGPNRPTVLGDACDIEHAQTAPLIVDWTTSARSRLEAAVLRRGVLTVKVSACDIEPLWQCESKARYAYASATSRRESERIADNKSLYARVPVSAVSLEAKLSAGGELSVDKTTVGRFESEPRTMAQSDFSGACEGATHFISAVDVGAFEFNAFRSHSAAAGAKTAAVGVGGETSGERELLSADGDLARCAEAGPGQTEPPAGCGAPIQIELTPLLPSLDVQAWRELAVRTTHEVMQQCHQHGIASTSELYVFLEPSGEIRPSREIMPFDEGNVDTCILDVWARQKLEPFSGPPLVAQVFVYVYPPARHAEFAKTIEANYRDSTPGIPPLELGQRLYYPWERHGITPTDAWQ